MDDRPADTFAADAAVPKIGRIAVEEEPSGLIVTWPEQVALESGQSYSVQISDDSGRTWQTVAIGLKSPRARLPKEILPRDRSLLVRVQATNGFHVVKSVAAWQSGIRQIPDSIKKPE